MKSEQVTKSQLISTAEKNSDARSWSDTSLFGEDLVMPQKMLDIFNVFEDDKSESAEE